MFTGIIRFIGVIQSWKYTINEMSILRVAYITSLFETTTIGDSIAVNGCCLTIAIITPEYVEFNVMEETVKRTTFKTIRSGDHVHLEKAATSFDGHTVTGHVFGTSRVLQHIVNADSSHSLRLLLNNATRYINAKDSIALDGVSLTVVHVQDNWFSVNCIPITLQQTLLGNKCMGSVCNMELEHDVICADLENDICWDPMTLARMESMKGRFSAAPNPWVGCVIVNSAGVVIASDYHHRRGEKHAERLALEQIDPAVNLSEATLYCTLEPCCHIGSQPPCTNYLIERGIKKVVVGILDPDERVSGMGITQLRAAGIDVTVMDDPFVKKSLRPYIIQRKYQRPYLVGKMSQSLDGKIGHPYQRTQLSNPEMQMRMHRYRRRCQGILIGSETAIIDNPQLSCRMLPEEELLNDNRRYRIVVDGRGRTGQVGARERITYLWNSTPYLQTLIFTSESCSEESKEFWLKHKVQYEIISVTTDGKLNVNEIVLCCGKRGILYLLIEGGAQIMTSFVPWLDKLILNISPVILGSNAISIFATELSTSHLLCRRVVQVGNDVSICYTAVK